MKNLRFFTFALAAATLAVSCAREISDAQTPIEEGIVEMSFTAGQDLSSKTSLNADKYIVWTAGDKLSVFDGLRNRCFTTNDAGATAVFSGVAKPEVEHYAVYPYNETFEMTAPGIFNVSVPYSQRVVNGNFGEGANLAVGKAESGVFHMKNACGYIRVDVSGCSKDLISITLDAGEGNFITGKAEVDFTTGTPAISPTEGNRRLALQPAEGYLGNGSYYAVAIPGEIKDNITAKIISSEGYSAIVTASAINIVRNTDAGSRIALDLSSIEWTAPATNEIYLRFVKNDSTLKLIMPFTPDIKRSNSGVVEEDVNGIYSAEGYNWYLRLSSSYCKFNSSTGFNLGGYHDYITFPIIAGKALKRVDIKFYTEGANKSVSLRTDQGVVPGGEPKTEPCASGDTVSFIPAIPEYDRAYTLFKESSVDARIHFIHLVYSGLDILQINSVTINDSEINKGVLDVSGTVEVNNPELGYVSWGLEYCNPQSQNWVAFANGDGLNIAGTVKNAPCDTLKVRAWAKADDYDRVYSEEKEYIWKHPIIDSINVQKTLIKNNNVECAAEVAGSNFDKGLVKWGVDYRVDTASGSWTQGPRGEGTVIEATFPCPADSCFVRFWAQGDDKPTVYSDIIKVKFVPVNVKSVSVDYALLKKGKLKFRGTVKAENPTAGELNWGLQYRAPGTTSWTDGPTGIGAAISDSIDIALPEVVVRLWAQAPPAATVYSDTLKAKSKLTVALDFTTQGIEYVKTYGLGPQGDSVGVDSSFPLPLPTSTTKRSTVRPLPLTGGTKSDVKKAAFDEFNLKAYGLPWKIEGSYSGTSGRVSIDYYFNGSSFNISTSSLFSIPAVDGYVFCGLEFDTNYTGTTAKWLVNNSPSNTTESTGLTHCDSSTRPLIKAGEKNICDESLLLGPIKPEEGKEYYLWIMSKMTVSNLKYFYEPCE